MMEPNDNIDRVLTYFAEACAAPPYPSHERKRVIDDPRMPGENTLVESVSPGTTCDKTSPCWSCMGMKYSEAQLRECGSLAIRHMLNGEFEFMDEYRMLVLNEADSWGCALWIRFAKSFPSKAEIDPLRD